MESIRNAPESPLRARRELTPDKLELIRLSRSLHLRTEEFTPLTDEDAPAPAIKPGRDAPREEDPVFDVKDLEAGAGEGESL
jgi:hypothetical protein